jgi:hypothetical protein
MLDKAREVACGCYRADLFGSGSKRGRQATGITDADGGGYNTKNPCIICQYPLCVSRDIFRGGIHLILKLRNMLNDKNLVVLECGRTDPFFFDFITELGIFVCDVEVCICLRDKLAKNQATVHINSYHVSARFRNMGVFMEVLRLLTHGLEKGMGYRRVRAVVVTFYHEEVKECLDKLNVDSSGDKCCVWDSDFDSIDAASPV